MKLTEMDQSDRDERTHDLSAWIQRNRSDDAVPSEYYSTASKEALGWMFLLQDGSAIGLAVRADLQNGNAVLVSEQFEGPPKEAREAISQFVRRS